MPSVRTKARIERVEVLAEKVLLAWCKAGLRPDPESNERKDLAWPDGTKVEISACFDVAMAFVDESEEAAKP